MIGVEHNVRKRPTQDKTFCFRYDAGVMEVLYDR